ncbi:MAG: hypothetical protein ACFE96_03815 [Candidatus Hermodarchaeota archaeon]
MDLDFLLEDDGKILCKNHSQIHLLRNVAREILNLQEEELLEEKFRIYDEEYRKVKKCKTCNHYINDDCYFHKGDIDKIR